MNAKKIIGWLIFFILLALIIVFVPFSKEKIVKCERDSDCAIMKAGCCEKPETINSKYMWMAKIKEFFTTRGCGKVQCESSEAIADADLLCKDNVCTIKYKR